MQIQSSSNKLISVVILTYNSEPFIVDTLNSIKLQTYPNVELIIADDCSQDNTVILVQSWLETNEDRFSHCCIVKGETNLGIASNSNRGLREAHGEFIKFIAGDDMLLPDCIANNVSWTNKHGSDLLFSRMLRFSVDNNFTHLHSSLHEQDQTVPQFFLYDVAKQYQALLRQNYLEAPSLFIRRKSLLAMEGFDEMCETEDYQLWLRATRRGIKLEYMPVPTVLYRIDNLSAFTYNPPKMFKNPKFLAAEFQVFIKYQRPYLPKLEAFDLYWFFIIQYLIVQCGNKKRFYKLFRYLRLLSPYFVWNLPSRLLPNKYVRN